MQSNPYLLVSLFELFMVRYSHKCSWLVRPTTTEVKLSGIPLCWSSAEARRVSPYSYTPAERRASQGCRNAGCHPSLPHSTPAPYPAPGVQSESVARRSLFVCFSPARGGGTKTGRLARDCRAVSLNALPPAAAGVTVSLTRSNDAARPTAPTSAAE